ncbi:MAG: NADPH-dependent FMN reductase [Chloroflexota bacterium]
MESRQSSQSSQSSQQRGSGPLFIPVVLGSIRRNRRSYYPARFVAERVEAAGHRTQLIDLRELRLPMYDEEEATDRHDAVLAFKAVMARSDASIWFSPEYNHSFTGVIKNAIDHLHDEVRRKPIAACGLAGGVSGGIRASEGLKMVLIELHAVPIRESIHFGEARVLFDAEGNLQRPDFIRRVDYMLAELAWYARALKWGRDHLPIPQRDRS